MNVFSCFDGISCGQVALKRAGIAYDKYYSSEIDKNAIKVTQHHFPATIQLGDICKIKDKDLPHIDLMLAGSPCQGFSAIGKGLNFDDPRSRLFFEFYRLMKEIKPKYFLLENVVMKKESRDVISKYLGVEAKEIDSALVSAQRRRRLYWTNIPIDSLPADKNIFLKDVIDHKLSTYKVPLNWQKYVPVSMPLYCDPYNKKAISGKSTALRTNVNNGNIWIKTTIGYRNLSRTEAELLQTVDVGYTNPVSESIAKKLLGNGWTVDIIAHILKGIK